MNPAAPLVRTLRSAARRAAVLLGRKQTVQGITVVDLVIRDEDRAALAAVGDAIELIARYDGARYRRMLRDVRYLVVTHTAASAGEYREDIRSILLDATNIVRQTPTSVAMVIVHEATHARLWRMGAGRHPDRARVEGACVGAEIQFARKIPGTERLIAGAEAKLATRYWEGSRPGTADRYLKRLGLGKWARRILGTR